MIPQREYNLSGLMGKRVFEKCIYLVVVQRVLWRWRVRWIRRWELPDELITVVVCISEISLGNPVNNIDGVYGASCRGSGVDTRIASQIGIGVVGCYYGLLCSNDGRDRCCSLYNRWFRMSLVATVIFPFPQFATNKPYGDHCTVAPDHLVF